MIEIEVRQEEKFHYLKPTGDLDLDGMAKFKDVISTARRNGAKNLVIDFEGIGQLMSSQIHNLVAPIKAIFLIGGKIIFVNLGNHERLIKNSMLNSMIVILASIEEARQQLAK